MVLKLKIIRSVDGADLPLPSYASRYHMGLNLAAGVSATLRLAPGERVYVPTGFAFGIPPGYVGQILSNTDLARMAGIIVLDAPGIIHPADRKPLFILLQNTSSHPYLLSRGTTIAQLVIMPAIQVAWDEYKTELSASSGAPATPMALDAGYTPETNVQPAHSRRVVRSIRNRYKKDPDE
ncbi:MAG: dUTP diphosphatase [Alphaproteobacteria bacterium]|nr:dUTP diphosphatase [Alphaproteobacteria bacterium]